MLGNREVRDSPAGPGAEARQADADRASWWLQARAWGVMAKWVVNGPGNQQVTNGQAKDGWDVIQGARPQATQQLQRRVSRQTNTLRHAFKTFG